MSREMANAAEEQPASSGTTLATTVIAGNTSPTRKKKRKSLAPLMCHDDSSGRISMKMSREMANAGEAQPALEIFVDSESHDVAWVDSSGSSNGSLNRGLIHISTRRSGLQEVVWRLTWPMRAHLFEDPATEARFQEAYWRKEWPLFMASILIGAVWGFLRFGLGILGRSTGWDASFEWSDSIYRFFPGVQDAQINMVLYEALYPAVWFVLLCGPRLRLDENLLAIAMGWIPESLRQRYSDGGLFDLWNSDGTLCVGSLGRLLGYVSAIGVAPIAASPYLGWANVNAMVMGASDQLPWVVATFPIMQRYLFPHALIFFTLSLSLSWAGFILKSTQEGGGAFFVERLVFLLIATAIMSLMLVCVNRHESGVRKAFMQLENEAAMQEVLLNVLKTILPSKAVERIAECAMEDAPLDASAKIYPDTAVIFIRVNLDEASIHGKNKMSELNKIFGMIDSIISIHPDVYKVETVGAEYLCAVGVPEACQSPTCAAIAFALHAVRELKDVKWNTGVPVELKVGIHSGALTAGISGTVSPQFRLFGDTVNTASRMKSQAGPGEVIVSDSAVAKVKACCGVESESDGRMWCTQPGIALANVGERECKGLGSMRLWKVEDSQESSGAVYGPCPHELRGSRLPFERMVSCSYLGLSRWLSWSRRVTLNNGDVTDLMAFEDVVNMLPKQCSLQIQRYPRFLFKDPQVEAYYRQWLANTAATTRSSLAGLAVFYVLLMISSAHSFATFHVEPTASSNEWRIFRAVCIFFFVATPLALAGVVCVSIYGGDRMRGKYAWAECWVYAFVIFGFMVWTIMPSKYFPATMGNNAMENLHTVHNLFEALMFPTRDAMDHAQNRSTSPYKYANFGGFQATCLAFGLQVVFGTRVGFTFCLSTLYIATCVYIQIVYGVVGGTTEYILLGFVCLQVSFLSVLKKREFRSMVHAARSRVFVSRIIQTLLPDHVFKACLTKETENISDECICGHFFLDLKGFTAMSKHLTPQQSFDFISHLFGAFDEICDKWGVTKIETIGDAYWCAVGLPHNATKDEMISLLGMGFELQKVLREKSLPCLSIPAIKDKGFDVGARIAIHYGACQGGVVGNKRPRYHLFGAAVEVVQELEQEGSVHGVVVSDAAARVMGLEEVGIIDDSHLLSMLKAVDDKLLNGALAMEEYPISEKGLRNIRRASEIHLQEVLGAEGVGCGVAEAHPVMMAPTPEIMAFMVVAKKVDEEQAHCRDDVDDRLAVCSSVVISVTPST